MTKFVFAWDTLADISRLSRTLQYSLHPFPRAGHGPGPWGARLGGGGAGLRPASGASLGRRLLSGCRGVFGGAFGLLFGVVFGAHFGVHFCTYFIPQNGVFGAKNRFLV